MRYQTPEEVAAGRRKPNPSGPACPSSQTRRPQFLTRPQWAYQMPFLLLFVCFLFSFSGEIAPSRGLPKTSTLKPTGFSLWGPRRFRLSPFPPPPPRILGFTWAGLSERPGSLLPSVGRTGVGGAPSYPGSRGLPSFLPQVLLSEGPSPVCPVSYFQEI